VKVDEPRNTVWNKNARLDFDRMISWTLPETFSTMKSMKVMKKILQPLHGLHFLSAIRDRLDNVGLNQKN
jgi:hypothetical protein